MPDQAPIVGFPKIVTSIVTGGEGLNVLVAAWIAVIVVVPNLRVLITPAVTVATVGSEDV